MSYDRDTDCEFRTFGDGYKERHVPTTLLGVVVGEPRIFVDCGLTTKGL